ncbi:MAG: transporter substrate-binding domain-containing protein [Spirochaetales bacterium]|nr:transporter substrate-binding domain-containing protein [Spirochaetales bacterium]
MNHKKTAAALLFIFLISLHIFPQADRSRNSRDVVIGIFSFSPINFINEAGQPDGLFPSIIEEIARESGWKVRYREGSFSQGMERLQNGEIDLMVSTAWSESRAERMDYSGESVVELWGQVFIPGSSKIRNINDLQGKTVGVVKKDITGQNLIRTAEIFDITFNIREYSTFFEVFEAVEAGHIHAGAAPHHFGLRYGPAYGLVGSSIMFSPFSIYFTVKKGTNRDLLDDIDRNLAAWKQDRSSVYYDALKYWMTPEELRQRTVPPWVRIIIPFFSFLILFILVTSILIRNSLNRRIKQIFSREQRYRSLVQKIEAFILRITPEGTVTVASDYTQSLLKTGDLTGQNIFDLNILPDNLTAGNLQEIVNLNQKEKENISCIPVDGGEQYFQWHLHSVGTEENDNIICIGINVTDRIRVESALKVSDERFISFMNNIPAFAYIRDSQGKLVYTNPAVAAMMSNPDSDSLEDYISDPELIRKINDGDQRIINRESEMETLEYEVQLPGEGRPIHIHNIRFPINMPHNEMLIGGFAIDVSESKEIEEQLNQSRKMEAIGELAGGIAHDFNNQLAGIMGYTDLLSHGINDERQEKYISKLKSAIEGASELTSQLLSFSRKSDREHRALDINDLTEELISLLSHSIGIQIKIHFNDKADRSVIVGDKNRIQNALLNISINARDAMDNQGDLYFSTQNIFVDEKMSALQGYVLEPGPYVKVSVEDSGNGIPKEIRDKIFEPFFTTKSEGRGTGMGLAQVYGTMQEHKGNITVQSTRDRGTVFSLYFPGSEEHRTEAETEVNLVEDKKNYTIAVVDDESMIREFLKLTLSGSGHTLRLFEKGEDFIDTLKEDKNRYDLVILDMIMPGMSGVECYREMMKINSRMRVLLSSGYSRKEEAEEIMANKNVLYIQKPFSITELTTAIRNLMAGRNDH